MNAWVVVELAAGALAGTVVLGVAVGRLARLARDGRPGRTRPLNDDPEHLPPLAPPPGLIWRPWLIVDARVVHDEHGVGTVVSSPAPSTGWVGVRFDDGPGRWVPPGSLDPITPDDERLLAQIRNRRPVLPEQHPRED